jgi:hypothetical protein
LREEGNNIYFDVGGRLFSIPAQEVVLVDINVPSAEELAGQILNDLKTHFTVPSNIKKIELGLDESWGQGAWSTWELR